MTDTSSRRSLALRSEGDTSSSLRPYAPGHVDFTGATDHYISTTRTALSTCTTLELSIRVRLDAVGVANRLVSWDNNGAVLEILPSNFLCISVVGATGTIGNAPSTVQIPQPQVLSQPVWLRGRVVTGTAVCSYWYSVQQVDTYDEVTWTALGTSPTGTFAGGATVLANSTVVTVGNTMPSTTSMTGNVFAFNEIVNAAKKSWFSSIDIPLPQQKTFTSSGGGQVWTLSTAAPATLFHQSHSLYGGLRSDPSNNAVTSGLTSGELLGVVDVDYSTVRVSYRSTMIPVHPTLGAFAEAMVVRSTAGFPATNIDGSPVMQHLSADAALAYGVGSTLDQGLSQQQWYYYCLFVRYDTTSGWFKVAERAWLNPGQFGYPDRLYQGFPDYYRRVDSGGWSHTGTLRKLCDVLGYEFDAHRTWAASVGDVWDFEKLSAKLVPEAGAALGMPQEAANGDRRLRTLVGNLMALRKIKGTKDGVEGYVGALTGYPTRAYEGLNLLHRLQHTEWPNSFAANDGTGDPLSDNHSGWRSKIGTTVYGQVSRQVAASNEGSTVGMPDGSFYLRLTNTTGVSSTMDFSYGGGDALEVLTSVIVVGGHNYKFSTALKASVASTVVRVSMDWYDQYKVLISSTVHTLATVGTGWVRAVTPSMPAPADAVYGRPHLQVVAGMANLTHINIYKPMLVDLAWRPEGIPSLINTAPLSSVLSADIGTYVHQDYYESPREVKINIYPQRTNLALNSDFKLNNLPAGAWSTFDAPTYGQVPTAYTDYADIIDAAPDWETSYSDMASGLYPLTGTPPTLIWDTAGGRLHVNKTVAPFGWTLMHTYFPATDLGGMSAAVGAYSTNANTKLTLAFEWYDAIGSSIKVGTIPVRHVSPEYTLKTAEQRCELVNAQPPDNALYGRLLVMVSNTVANDTSLSWALIEDAPYPESYFDGTNNNGDDGDFFFAVGKGYTGDSLPYQSPSVYYMRFRRFASGAAGSDALSTLMPTLLPFRRSFKIVTAATGLYNVPV